MKEYENKLTTIKMRTNSNETIEKVIRTNDVTKRITVEEVENGYIITYCTHGRRNKTKAKPEGEYFDETKKWISKTNPLSSTKIDSKGTSKNASDTDINKKFLDSISGDNFFKFD